MTARRTEHQYRKDLLLGIVVNEYIKTVNPVGSAFITKEYLPDLSSATIRNILAELEEEGFLTHPHTSAGRMPTEEGYRYYVDHLMHEIQLLEDEKRKIKEEYERNLRDLESVLDKTSEVMADFTHYTSIISIDARPDKIFCKGTSYIVEYPDPQDVQKIRSILEAIEKKEQILEVINRQLRHRIEIYIGHEIALSDVENCSLVVSSYKAPKGMSGRIAILGPTRMNYQKVVSALDYFSDLMEEML
ncbi:MAG: hypothetical protein NUV91_04820 [Candidatus Omnitrophica bacterium]|nr:hypothetical protein [Candidatus Omnitrophota bacterium]